MAELTRAYVRKRRSQWQVAKVETPEFGAGSYTWVRKLAASVIKTHGALFKKAEAEGDKTDGNSMETLAGLCSLGICSKDGEPLYSTKQAAELLEWPFATLNRCAAKLIEFNGLNESAKVKAKNLPASRRVSSRSRSQKKSRKR